MRIVSWNCNGKFREKYKQIVNVNADIYVIQECENPETSDLDYKNYFKQFYWIGDKKNKGLGIFINDDSIIAKKNKWKTYCLRNFLSININNQFDLIGVWDCRPYIEEYYIYQEINYNNYNGNSIILGDFNSNKIWDKDHHERNHSEVVRKLKEKNLISAYHYIFKEEQGKETKNTFYLYRHPDKGYHIDHCFIKKERIINYQILDDPFWLTLSDHLPILIDINNKYD